MIEQSLLAIEDEEFVSACHDCASLEAIRQQLGLTPEATDARRHERHQREQEAERRRRTFDVAGTPFEVGTTSGVVAPLWLRAKSAYGGGRGMFRA